MGDYLWKKVQDGGVETKPVRIPPELKMKPRAAWILLNLEIHESTFGNLFPDRRADGMRIFGQEVLNTPLQIGKQKLHITFRNRGRFTKSIQDKALPRS